MSKSDSNINRWHNMITPREKAPLPWTIGSGGSWDMLEVQPIPDSMLAELAQMYHSHGCPWNCQNMPLSPSDREYMYLLYYSMQGLVARMRLAEKKAAEVEEQAARASAGSTAPAGQLLDKYEQREALKNPRILAALIDWHDYQQDCADSMEAGTQGDKTRAEELRAIGRAIIQQGDTSCDADTLRTFGLAAAPSAPAVPTEPKWLQSPNQTPDREGYYRTRRINFDGTRDHEMRLWWNGRYWLSCSTGGYGFSIERDWAPDAAPAAASDRPGAPS